MSAVFVISNKALITGSVISMSKYPYPSDHGSQVHSSSVSSTVGDYVRSPNTDLLLFVTFWIDIMFYPTIISFVPPGQPSH